MSAGAPAAPAGTTVSGASGALRFAAYAYPPNALGYCGPGDAAELLGAAGSGDAGAVAKLATEFEGAWPYLELIAACNGIADPLDDRVTEAYWLGNGLLAKVPGRLLAASLDDRFARRAGAGLPLLVEAAFLGGVAQHSFHVFAVSPWIGMLRAGRSEPALRVLDRCRVRWGCVEEVADGQVTVTSRPLVLTGSRLHLGPPLFEVARCRSAPGESAAGDSEGRPLRPGDRVSLHWDWVCERLEVPAWRRLASATARNLEAVNAASVPGPAAALDAAGC